MEQHNKKSKKRQGRRSEAQSAGFEAVARGTLTGSGIALVCMLTLALISAAVGMRYSDPASLSLPMGLAILYISSAIGGIFSCLQLRKDISAALTASAFCGFTLFVLTGICAVLQGILAPEVSHGIGPWVSIPLRALIIAVSILSAYIFCKTRVKKQKRRR